MFGGLILPVSLLMTLHLESELLTLLLFLQANVSDVNVPLHLLCVFVPDGDCVYLD